MADNIHIDRIVQLAETPMVMPSTQYSVVVIDPPWPMVKIPRRVRPNQIGWDYPTMTVAEIQALDVQSLLLPDSLVFLWTTEKYLPTAFETLTAWQLRYRFTMVWHKPGGFQVLGYPQYNAEFVVCGSTGKMPIVDTKAFNVCFNANRTKHSEKPEEFYSLLTRVTKGPRIDLFNRRIIEGFDGWGDEAITRSGMEQR